MSVPFRRAACMPPLRMDRTPSQCKKLYHKANGHGGVKISALRAAFGGCAPKRRCGASPKRACGRSPALQSKNTHHVNRKRAAAMFYHTANLIFCAAKGRTPPSFFIFHFYFLIFNFLRFLIFQIPSRLHFARNARTIKNTNLSPKKGGRAPCRTPNAAMPAA